MIGVFHFPFISFFSLFLRLGVGGGGIVSVDSEYEGGERNFLRPSERAVGEGPFSMPHLRLNVITPLRNVRRGRRAAKAVAAAVA